MSWVPFPTKHDGSGFRRVAGHERAADLFAAWVLIVQTAAKMPTRGLLYKDGRALTASDLHFGTGFPEEIFHLAFNVLTNTDIGWLERVAGDAITGTPEHDEESENPIPEPETGDRHAGS
jgi:hypothetical protein